MAWIRCPRCNARNGGLPEQFHDRVQCDDCGKMFLAEIKDGRARNASPAGFVLDPPAGLDSDLSSDLREACACFTAGAYKASLVMARRFLEGLLDKRGFKGRTLADRIKAAHDSGAVSELHFQLASSTRILGNY